MKIKLKDILLNERMDAWEKYTGKLEAKGEKIFNQRLKMNLKKYDEEEATERAQKETFDKISKDPMIKKLENMNVVSNNYERWRILKVEVYKVDKYGWPYFKIQYVTRGFDPKTNKDIINKDKKFASGGEVNYED